MFLVNFIFVVSHLKIHTTVHLHNLKADAIVVKKKTLSKVYYTLLLLFSN